jgi:hypothetical protein
LLNPAHPDNGGKAEFFHSLGFRREEWEVLAGAFRGLATTTEVAERLESAHGLKLLKVRVWFDAEGDFLEVRFRTRPGSCVRRTMAR